MDPLNYLVNDASTFESIKYILFQSCEIMASGSALEKLLDYMHKEGQLVAGARLAGHDFSKDRRVLLSGTTSPWNTFALWDLPSINTMGGFMDISNSCEGRMGGVEEIVVIASARAAGRSV